METSKTIFSDKSPKNGNIILSEDDDIIRNPTKCAEIFNKYFISAIESLFFFFFLSMHFYPGTITPKQSQLIQIYNLDWTDIYDTHNIEHRTEPFSH